MSIWRDLRYAARSLRRAPGFTVVAVLVLAVGIGANSAMFSLVDAALVRPLPFAQSDRLVMLWERSPRFPHNRVSPLNFLDWSEQQQAFASVAAIAGGGRTLTGSGGEAERIPGQAVTWQFFDDPRHPSDRGRHVHGRRHGEPADGGRDQRAAVEEPLRQRSVDRRPDADAR